MQERLQGSQRLSCGRKSAGLGQREATSTSSAPQPKPAPEARSLPLVTLSPEEGSPQPPQCLWATLGGVWVVQSVLMKCPS